MMEYRSVSDLNASVREWAQTELVDVDLVVGIPRSGLLAANLLCLHLNCPMTDVDGLCNGELLDTGHRYVGAVSAVSEAERVLVLDDSVNTGRQMTETRERLDGYDFPFDIEYGAVYISPDGYKYVDLWHEIVPMPRVFEWNMTHHPNLGSWCVDIDGVLCRDPTERENDDGKRYEAFISEIEPRIIPTQKIGWLVTCRLEKYRDQTEAWLARHGIEYEELVMVDLPSKEARQRAGCHGEYKAAVYEATDASLFVESSVEQALEIVERTGRPVYCFEENRMIQPGTLDHVYHKSTSYLEQFADNPVTFSIRTMKFLLKRGRRRIDLASRKYFNQ